MKRHVIHYLVASAAVMGSPVERIALPQPSTISEKMISAESAVGIILDIMQSGDDAPYIGEQVSQLEHALQAAQMATNTNPHDHEMIIAALLHDIGHLCAPQRSDTMEGVGIAQHENIGADFLQACGFSQRITETVRGHIQAKRYLVYKRPEYYHTISQASKTTLKHQGGPMSAQEARAFESDPFFSEKVQLRLWDEASKVIGQKVATLESYKDILLAHLTNTTANEHRRSLFLASGIY